MTQAGSNRRLTDRASEMQRRTPDAIERPEVDTTVRKFAIECIDPAHEAWERATEGRNGEWKQLTFFWLRELKRHPKLNGKSPQEVANAVISLFQTEPAIKDLFEGDDFGENDILTFVEARWSSIRCAGGENPLLAAGRIAKGQQITWQIPDTPEMQSSVESIFASQGLGVWRRYAGKKCKAWWHELDYNPIEGLFLATIWTLRNSMFDPQQPTEPVLILPCTTLGQALGVHHTTAWDHRRRAGKRKLIELLPRQSKQDADRFRLCKEFPVILTYFQERHLERPRTPSSPVDLD